MPNTPNLLFILTDQQRYDSLRCYGNDWIQAPALNRLAEQSFVFENAYVSQPVCTPARSTIMTGLYPHTSGQIRNGIPLRPGTKTIAEMVSDDYLRGHFGKWHLGDDLVPQHGFERWVSVEDLHLVPTERPDRLSDYHNYLIDHGYEPQTDAFGLRVFSEDEKNRIPVEHHQSTFLGDHAARFIRSAGEGPFMLFVDFVEPHPPYTGPLDGLYDPESLPVGPAFLRRPEETSQFNTTRADYYLSDERSDPPGIHVVSGHDLSSEAGWRRLRAQYFANITLLDRAVGKILAALDDSGLAENTVVVFTSEHGEMGGDHAMLEKRSFYEEASRVPLLIRAPFVGGRPRSIGGSIGQVDLVPTLLELLNQPAPEGLQGRSRAGVLEGSDTLSDNDVFVQWNGAGDRDLGNEVINRLAAMPRRSVITGDRWKLNLCATDQGELFDLNADPHETTNLFDVPEHRDRVHDMAARIRRWQVETGDDAPMPSV